MALYKYVVKNASCLAIASYEPKEANLDDLKRELAKLGYAAVPVEPTEEMLTAAEEGIRDCSYPRKGMRVIQWKFVKSGWDAMIEAANA